MYEKVTLSSLKDGALEELFQYELAKVLDNLADTNTDKKKKRSITINLEMIPNEDMSMVQTTFSVKSSLAPIKPRGCFLALPAIGEQPGLFQETAREIPLVEENEDNSISMKSLLNKAK